MTRNRLHVQPKWGWKRFPPDRGEKNRIHLSDDQAESLGYRLGFYSTDTKWEGFVDYVELILSCYFTLANAIDNKPRAAHVRAAVSSLREEADAFLRHVSALDDVSGELLGRLLEVKLLSKRHVLLKEALAPSQAAQEKISLLIPYLKEEFIPACDATVSALDGVDSRGRPKREALRITIYLLCDVFNHYFNSELLEVESVVEEGSGERQLRRKGFQVDFVSTALGAAGISHPKGEELARLFPHLGKNMR